MTKYALKQGIQTTKDLSPIREFHLEDSNQIIYAKRVDPFGFWYVNFKHGTIPETLDMAFTTFAKAREAIEHYLRLKDEKESKRRVEKVKLTPPEPKEDNAKSDAKAVA
jgi:hypothetical protein